MPILAFFNLGPTEILLVLLLLLLLFGAEQLPAMARRVGRLKGQLDRAGQQVRESVLTEEDKALEEQLAFERARDQHMMQQNEESLRLQRAAHELGVITDGLSDEQIRAAIAAKMRAEPSLEGEAAQKSAAEAAKQRSLRDKTRPPDSPI